MTNPILDYADEAAETESAVDAQSAVDYADEACAPATYDTVPVQECKFISAGDQLIQMLQNMKSEKVLYYAPALTKFELAFNEILKRNDVNFCQFGPDNVFGSILHKKENTTNCSTAVLEAIYRLYGGSVESVPPSNLKGKSWTKYFGKPTGGSFDGLSLSDRKFQDFALEFQKDGRAWIDALQRVGFGAEVDRKSLQPGDIVQGAKHRMVYLRTTRSDKNGYPRNIQVISANVMPIGKQKYQGYEAIQEEPRAVTSAMLFARVRVSEG